MISPLKTYRKFLMRNKVYTFVCVVGFAISIMFVIVLGLHVKQELSFDQFHEKKDRIYFMVTENGAGIANPVAPILLNSVPEVENYCRALSEQMAVEIPGGEITGMVGLLADSSFFDMFSFRLLDGSPGSVLAEENSVVVTPRFINKVFPGENPVGKTVKIYGKELTITGIMENMPYNTQFPDADFVASYPAVMKEKFSDNIMDNWDNSSFCVYILDLEGSELPSKSQEIIELLKTHDYWIYTQGHAETLQFLPLTDVHFYTTNTWVQLRSRDRTQINIYMGVALLILLISVLNYLNMTVAQAGFRGRETAIKKLLGSSRSRIVAQLLLESFLMTALAFTLAMSLAFLAEPFFDSLLQTELDLAGQFTADTILWLVGALAAVSLISGIVPAIVISRFEPIEIVKGTLARKVKGTYSRILITFQYTIALILLICSFFIVSQFRFFMNHNLGYEKDLVYIVDNNTGLYFHQLQGFRERLLEIPGVESVSLSCGTPVDAGNNWSFKYNDESFSFQVFNVDREFFRIYGLDSTLVNSGFNGNSVILNRTAYNALGLDNSSNSFVMGGEIVEVHGVIDDFYFNPLYFRMGPSMLVSMEDNTYPWSASVLISKNANVADAAARVEKTYKDFFPGSYFYGQFAAEEIQRWYKDHKMTSRIMNSFAGLTVLIMIMGVFAMSLYMIKQKEKEIAIRKANGSSIWQAMMLLNRNTLVMTLVSFIIACPITYYAVSKWLNNFAYHIEITAWPFIAAGVAVLLLSLLSVSWQTWRAARANPIVSLRSE